jgi:hypothetical protein
VAAGLALLLGAIVAPVVIACNSLIHLHDDETALGRIFSNLEVVMHVGFMVFMFITSYLADRFSPFIMVFIIGIIGLVLSLYSWIKDFENTAPADTARGAEDVVG